MKKINFVTLFLSTIGTLVFGAGMCMALIEEWNMMNQGIVIGLIGLVILLVMVLIRRKMSGKQMIKLNVKMIGYIIYTLFALIVFGAGLAIVTSIQEYMILGIIFGVVGIVLLISLIPMLKGLKD